MPNDTLLIKFRSRINHMNTTEHTWPQWREFSLGCGLSRAKKQTLVEETARPCRWTCRWHEQNQVPHGLAHSPPRRKYFSVLSSGGNNGKGISPCFSICDTRCRGRLITMPITSPPSFPPPLSCPFTSLSSISAWTSHWCVYDQTLGYTITIAQGVC